MMHEEISQGDLKTSFNLQFPRMPKVKYTMRHLGWWGMGLERKKLMKAGSVLLKVSQRRRIKYGQVV